MRTSPWIAAFVALTFAATTVPAGAADPDDPCATYRTLTGNRTAGVVDSAPGDGPLRVIAIQYKQLVGYVESYGTYAQKMDCLMRDYVQPNIVEGKKTLVVFNEDIGLASIAIGSRGAAARAIAASPVPLDTPALYDATGVPAGAAAALGSVAAGYAPQMAAYRSRYADEDPRKAIITAATDTFVRGFMTTFSKLARSYGVWIVASNNQAEFSYSTDPADVAAFADPDLAPQYAAKSLKGVWVASSSSAWNSAFLWGPETIHGARIDPGATDNRLNGEYDPRSNLLFTNKKTPLTDIEKQFLALDEGNMDPVVCGTTAGDDTCSGNAGGAEIPGLPGFKLGFAISLPAFEFDDPSAQNVCDRATTWMRCLESRGVNVVIQPEANPGPWARYGADGGRFQAETWGASTLRTVTDSTVPGFKYIVCAHMVGNLADLPFDGQTAILQRGRTGNARSYAGAWAAEQPLDGAFYGSFAGPKQEFLALAPWVEPDPDLASIANDRARLAETATKLMPGSLDPASNGYLETAVFADLSLTP